MSDAEVAGGLDRLPWLADENRKPAPRRGLQDLRVWATASVLLVAGLSFWIGSRRAEQLPESAPSERTTTVAVPEPRPAAKPEVRIAPPSQVPNAIVPDVRPSPTPQVRIAPPPARKIAPARAEPAVSQTVTAATHKMIAPRAAARARTPAALVPWPSRLTAGANGRLVQIGAYGSRLQAKRGWASMVRSYPAVAHLSAVVVETRNSRGRSFYRFQIGTTSQAHSEVLCQRMEKIELSCAVVGLPWKARVER
jgi:hypothetical protein